MVTLRTHLQSGALCPYRSASMRSLRRAHAAHTPGAGIERDPRTAPNSPSFAGAGIGSDLTAVPFDPDSRDDGSPADVTAAQRGISSVDTDSRGPDRRARGTGGTRRPGGALRACRAGLARWSGRS